MKMIRGAILVCLFDISVIKAERVESTEDTPLMQATHLSELNSEWKRPLWHPEDAEKIVSLKSDYIASKLGSKTLIGAEHVRAYHAEEGAKDEHVHAVPLVHYAEEGAKDEHFHAVPVAQYTEEGVQDEHFHAVPVAQYAEEGTEDEHVFAAEEGATVFVRTKPEPPIPVIGTVPKKHDRAPKPYGRQKKNAGPKRNRAFAVEEGAEDQGFAPVAQAQEDAEHYALSEEDADARPGNPRGKDNARPEFIRHHSDRYDKVKQSWRKPVRDEYTYTHPAKANIYAAKEAAKDKHFHAVPVAHYAEEGAKDKHFHAVPVAQYAEEGAKDERFNDMVAAEEGVKDEGFVHAAPVAFQSKFGPKAYGYTHYAKTNYAAEEGVKDEHVHAVPVAHYAEEGANDEHFHAVPVAQYAEEGAKDEHFHDVPVAQYAEEGAEDERFNDMVAAEEGARPFRLVHAAPVAYPSKFGPKAYGYTHFAKTNYAAEEGAQDERVHAVPVAQYAEEGAKDEDGRYDVYKGWKPPNFMPGAGDSREERLAEEAAKDGRDEAMAEEAAKDGRYDVYKAWKPPNFMPGTEDSREERLAEEAAKDQRYATYAEEQAILAVEEDAKDQRGKVRGSLARAGKVKGQTPKVTKNKQRGDRIKKQKRSKYNGRAAHIESTGGNYRKRGPNSQFH